MLYTTITISAACTEYHNILSAAFVVPALKPQESRKSLKRTARSFGTTDTER